MSVEDGAHSPGFLKCSAFLAHERDILGVGVETVGTDAGKAGGLNPPFPNHTSMHGAGGLGLPSLINLDQLPPTGAVVIAAPLKIVGGSAARCVSSRSCRANPIVERSAPIPTRSGVVIGASALSSPAT